MIDLHCHILPGIDDGPDTIEQSLALARAAAAGGTRTIVATPHVSWRYPNDAQTIRRLTDELGHRLAREGIPIEVRAGAEIAMTRAPELGRSELDGMRLGDGLWLLLEPPFSPALTGFASVLGELQSKGHRVIVAHPERCPAFMREPEALHALAATGALTSITAGSLTGRFGSQVRRFALRLLEEGLVHNVASDAHDAFRRPPGMARELEAAGLAELSEWLTSSVPAAILSGQEIPPQPAGIALPRARPRRLRWPKRG